MRKDMKKCPKPLGYGIRRTPVVLGLSAALCMPAAFRMQLLYNGMDSESVLSGYDNGKQSRNNLEKSINGGQVL